MAKSKTIKVQQSEITVINHNDEDFISLTDMIKNESDKQIDNWLRNKNTLEYLAVWEQLNNPNFNFLEFEEIKKEAGVNRFLMSVKQWIERTSAIGIIAKAGRYGGTYAHKDIAFEFGMWISPMFKLLPIKEFQRLKEEESKFKNIEWDYRRFLSKVNYRIHTDAIKEIIIPTISKEQESYVYANEAEILNVAMFGKTSKQWREENTTLSLKGLNIRDMASVPELTVLSNLESYNSILIKEGNSPQERFEKLKNEALHQLKSLLRQNYNYSIESPYLPKYERNNTFDQSLKNNLSKKDEIS